MSNEADASCYLVRTIPELVEKSIVGVGWSALDFSKMADAEEAIQEIAKSYGIGRRSNQIRRFFNMREDDYVVASLPYSVAIGKASGGLFYDEAYYPKDRANQRQVAFPMAEDSRVVTIPRNSFSESFQRRLRVQGMTVNSLDEFRDEIISAYHNVSHGQDYSWGLKVAEKVSETEEAFKASLLKNIQSGRTNLQTGGIGLERLVRELLELDGYQAAVLAKTAFPGLADADIKATRSDACLSVQMLVQVKHHQGFSNEHGLKQLEAITKAELPEYQDHQLVFCTSASLSDKFLERADANNINAIDGEGLVEWIHQHIDSLSKQTKDALGVCEVPTIL